MHTFYYLHKSTSKSKLLQMNIFEMLIAILMKKFLTTDIHPQFCENISILINVFFVNQATNSFSTLKLILNEKKKLKLSIRILNAILTWFRAQKKAGFTFPTIGDMGIYSRKLTQQLNTLSKKIAIYNCLICCSHLKLQSSFLNNHKNNIKPHENIYFYYHKNFRRNP